MRAVSIDIGSLSISVYGYQYPNMQDYWDGNWLVIDAVDTQSDQQVGLYSQPCLRVPELADFVQALKILARQPKGHVRLETLEPYLACEVARSGTSNPVSVNVRLKVKDPKKVKGPRKLHWFSCVCDVSEIGGWVKQIDVVLQAFPQKGNM